MCLCKLTTHCYVDAPDANYPDSHSDYDTSFCSTVALLVVSRKKGKIIPIESL